MNITCLTTHPLIFALFPVFLIIINKAMNIPSSVCIDMLSLSLNKYLNDWIIWSVCSTFE